MPSALVTALALACFGSAILGTAWSRLRIAAARRRAGDLVRDLERDEACEAAREVQRG